MTDHPMMLSLRLARIAAANAAAALQATVVIGRRLPAFASYGLETAARDDAEARRAVVEKLVAVQSGAIRAGFLWQKLVIAAMTGRIAPEAIPLRVAAITDAAFAPARRRVRANARRLTRF